MGRPRKFNEEGALRTAMNLFWSKGYEGTSLQDLMAAMQLSKSSFYQTFSSKHELLERSLRLYREEITHEMLRNLENAPSGIQFIRETLLNVAEDADRPGGRRGCLVMNCASEFAQRDPVIAALIADARSSFKAAFLAGIRRAQQEGDIAESRDPQALADYLVSSKSGLETMAKAGASPEEMKAVVDVVLSALLLQPTAKTATAQIGSMGSGKEGSADFR